MLANSSAGSGDDLILLKRWNVLTKLGSNFKQAVRKRGEEGRNEACQNKKRCSPAGTVNTKEVDQYRGGKSAHDGELLAQRETGDDHLAEIDFILPDFSALRDDTRTDASVC